MYGNFILINSLTFHSDIDECVQRLAGCDHYCTNTVGNYFCTCMDGYVLGSDNHTCTGDEQFYLSYKALLLKLFCSIIANVCAL